MAAFDFPNSPSVNDQYTANGVTFKWNGTIWQRISASSGAQGTTGSTGPTGAQGAAAGLTISTSAPGSPSAGDMWWDSDSGLFLTYYNDGNSSQWVELNQGPKGAQGATGPTGAQGATGSTGAQGAAGAQGATGAAGSNATISSNSDNRIITGGSGTNLVGEANLRFDGSQLEIETSAQNNLKINSSNSDGPNIHFERSGSAFAYLGSAAANTSGTATDLALRAQGNLVFATNGGNERLRIDSGGRVQIASTNNSASGTRLVVGSGNNMSATVLINTQDTDVNALTLSNWDGATTSNKVIVGFDNSGRGSFAMGMPASTNAFAFFSSIDGASNERLRIDSDGRLLHKHTASRNVGTKTGQLQVINSGNDAAISIIQTNNAGSAPFLCFGKTRSANTTGSTIVQDGDSLGQIVFAGADGTDIDSTGALITAQVDGTPGSNDMPGRLVFSTTADGATTSTERLRIDSSGSLLVANTTGSRTNLSGNADDIVIGNTSTSNETGISMFSTNASGIRFNDASGTDGAIEYAHSARELRFNSAGANRLQFGINASNSPVFSLGTGHYSGGADGNNHNQGDRASVKVGAYLHLESALGAGHNTRAGLGYNCYFHSLESFYCGTKSPSGGDNRPAAYGMAYGNHYFYSDASNTAHSAQASLTMTKNMVIHRQGVVSIPVGIELGSGTDATPAGNILDDYEEGTWTPTDVSGSSISFTINNPATYTKIGRLVHCTFDVTWAGGHSSGGNAAISSPFAMGEEYGSGSVGWNQVNKPLQTHVNSGGIQIMENYSNGSGSRHLSNNSASGNRIIGDATYFTAT